MCLVIPAAVCLLILGSFGNHYNSSVNSRLHNVKTRYQYVHEVPTPEHLDLGPFSSTAEVTGFLEYQFHVVGIVLYF